MAAKRGRGGRGREWDGDELAASPQPLAVPVLCLVRSAGDFAAGAFVGSLVGYGLFTPCFLYLSCFLWSSIGYL